MKFSELLQAIGAAGVLSQQVGKDPEILGVCEDSRKVKPGDVFVARGGTKVDGAKFVRDAVAAGAVAVISGERVDVTVPTAQVQNANKALALAAHAVAGRPTDSLTVLAVTGTNGKTTITYLVRAIIQAWGQKCGLIGTVQIDDGLKFVESEMTTPGPVDLTALFARMKQNGVRYCAIETSSHALHQDRVAGINFAVGMFTNLTQDHLDYHTTMDNYAAAKAILFENLSPSATAVENGDDAYAARMVRDSKARVVRYSVHGAGDWSATIESMTSAGMKLRIKTPTGETLALNSPLVGVYNVHNTLCAMGCAAALGVPTTVMIKALETCTGAPGRLQRVMIGKQSLPFQVFVDYAHTPDAVENVLKALKPLTKGRLICVFGCGGDRDRTKRPKMARAAQQLADVVVVTSDNPRTEAPQQIFDDIVAGFGGDWRSDGRIVVEPDRRTAINAAIKMAKQHDVILIAGKGHENYQIVGKTKHHFDDVEEAEKAIAGVL